MYRKSKENTGIRTARETQSECVSSQKHSRVAAGLVGSLYIEKNKIDD